MAYDIENNIFINCGKSGQVIKGLNGGGGNANPTWTIKGNAFNFDGADTSANEETGDADEAVTESVAGVFTFTNAEAGDFNGACVLAEDVKTPEALGDARWSIEYTETTGINAVAAAQQNAVIYNLAGQRVAAATKGLFIVNGKKFVNK